MYHVQLQVTLLFPSLSPSLPPPPLPSSTPPARCHVPTLLVDYVERGILSYHHPIEDEHLSLVQCLPMLKELHSSLLRGRRTAIQ